MSARTALEIATRGGAEVLDRSDIGALEPGRMADFFTLDLGRVEFAGGLHDPVAAGVMCSPAPARDVFVGGSAVIESYRHRSIDEGKLVEDHNRAAKRLV
jgi:cytosine/adenosine deaminase-related metal-dependent hydrolase